MSDTSVARDQRRERGRSLHIEVPNRRALIRLEAHLGEPPPSAAAGNRLGLVVTHPFPGADKTADTAFLTYPELADRLAFDTGFSVLAFAFRGCGRSTSDVSAAGWLEDLQAAVRFLLEEDRCDGVWLAGFGLGGAVALQAAAQDGRIEGVACFSVPADVDEWAADPKRLLEHCRAVGAVTTPGFPDDVVAWARELRDARAIDLIAEVAPRPLLVVHGTEDEVTSVLDARALVDAVHSAGAEVDLRLLTGGGNDLRHDPRAIAILIGWLERQGL